MSPKFQLTKANVPAIATSAAISLTAIAVAIAALIIFKMVFPTYDFTAIEAIVVTAAGGWITAVVREFVTEN